MRIADARSAADDGHGNLPVAGYGLAPTFSAISIRAPPTVPALTDFRSAIAHGGARNLSPSTVMRPWATRRGKPKLISSKVGMAQLSQSASWTNWAGSPVDRRENPPSGPPGARRPNGSGWDDRSTPRQLAPCPVSSTRSFVAIALAYHAIMASATRRSACGSDRRPISAVRNDPRSAAISSAVSFRLNRSAIRPKYPSYSSRVPLAHH